MGGVGSRERGAKIPFRLGHQSAQGRASCKLMFDTLCPVVSDPKMGSSSIIKVETLHMSGILKASLSGRSWHRNESSYRVTQVIRSKM